MSSEGFRRKIMEGCGQGEPHVQKALLLILKNKDKYCL
jgi:hypothetical protein